MSGTNCCLGLEKGSSKTERVTPTSCLMTGFAPLSFHAVRGVITMEIATLRGQRLVKNVDIFYLRISQTLDHLVRLFVQDLVQAKHITPAFNCS